MLTRDDDPGTRQVVHWNDTFNRIYAESGQHADKQRHGFAGRTSSYDHAPIPHAEMQEWVDQTVARIASLSPRRLLEIGCGTGLLLNRIAPLCQRYHGTDFSAVVVEQLRAAIAARAEMRDIVTLQQAHANAAVQAEGLPFDTIVINSVAQYFPGVDYLTQVIEQALDALSIGGTLFVGDLRHAGLLEAFHTSVELFRAGMGTPLAQLREAIAQGVRQESELLIDPAYFFALQRRFPRIGRVQVLAKGVQARNELTRFRYDAVIQVGETVAPGAPPIWRSWDAVRDDGPDPLARLAQQLRVPMDEPLALRDIPDAAVAQELTLAQALRQDDGSGTVESLLLTLDAHADSHAGSGIDRIALATLCAQHGLHLRIAPASGSGGHFHAVISAAPLQVDWRALYRGTGASDDAARFANQPAPAQA